MTSRSRLTLLCAACAAMLGTAAPAGAQAGPAAGADGAPQLRRRHAESGAAQQPPTAARAAAQRADGLPVSGRQARPYRLGTARAAWPLRGVELRSIAVIAARTRRRPAAASCPAAAPSPASLPVLSGDLDGHVPQASPPPRPRASSWPPWRRSSSWRRLGDARLALLAAPRGDVVAHALHRGRVRQRACCRSSSS